MFRPVTVGIDGSAASLAAASWAAHEAELRKTRLHLVSSRAWPVAARGEVGQAGEQERWARRSLTLAQDRLRSRHPDLPITDASVAAPPQEALLAEGADAQLLVLGSRGIGSPSRAAVGSTGMRTAAEASFPLALLRPEAASALCSARPVLLALDARRLADEVIAFAFEEAACRGVALHVRYAWGPGAVSIRYPAAPRPDLLASQARREAARLSAALHPWRDKWPAVRVVEDCLPETGAAAVVAGGATACLAVLGHRMRPRGGARLGPVAQAVLHVAAFPVVLVPHI
ncbi:universal stress protein [Streptomyces sp. ODS28]|uniref:universal stress protein n=1 Tax=Streptomyces sp. ODS28 TaxID=3136688 RepID=UPI0031EDF267